jgi:hypothetical protein
MTDVLLYWQQYEYLDYERDLAAREAIEVLGALSVREVDGGLLAEATRWPERAIDLVYFSAARVDTSDQLVPTRQSLIECSAVRSETKQATRYSVHGLHDYKGKFNPQIAQALLNLSGVQPGAAVLDPYCGSGTTVVEAAQRGFRAVGTDINPLAVLISKTKTESMAIPAEQLRESLLTAIRTATRSRRTIRSSLRTEYLGKWFPAEILVVLERLRDAARKLPEQEGNVLLLLVSDLLRDYSMQDPQDLRIRRRSDPLPTRPLTESLDAEVERVCSRLQAAQELAPEEVIESSVNLLDISSDTAAAELRAEVPIRAVITSPPYAMALPYIDTQRLSLVWLGLTAPSSLAELERTLTGSREVGSVKLREWNSHIGTNFAGLPPQEAALCRRTLKAIGQDDGFRRQAVPALLYRYFVQMRAMFMNVHHLVESQTPYYLVVGHNQSTLGGRLFEIDTPGHLANLASSTGWQLDEVLPLQTYRRFGLHARNAVSRESLIMLSA